MSRSIDDICKDYVAAWQERDLKALEPLLDPEIRFKSPTATTNGRLTFLQAAPRFLRIVEKVTVRSRFLATDEAMFVYDFACREPIGVSPTAELIRIQNGLIAYSEIFFGARPFAALTKASPRPPVSE